MLAPLSRLRRLLKPTLALLVCALPTICQAQAQAQAPKPAGPPPAAGVWKNLQFLPKDITKPALKATMREMAKSLNVDCDHCHKEPDMAADTDKKKIAREMMEMVKTINSKYPMTLKKVTCWTCHRGKPEPDPSPK